MIDLNKLTIKFKFTEGLNDIVAIASIEDDFISLRGFLIMKSKFINRRGELMRIVPPTFGPKHHFSVFFVNKNLWYAIEDKIWEEFDESLINNIVTTK